MPAGLTVVTGGSAVVDVPYRGALFPTPGAKVVSTASPPALFDWLADGFPVVVESTRHAKQLLVREISQGGHYSYTSYVHT